MILFCLVFAMFCARLFICDLWSPAGKGLTSWLSFVVSSVSLSLSHWYPGSGVVLDCIDSWSLHHYLLLEETFIMIYMHLCLISCKWFANFISRRQKAPQARTMRGSKKFFSEGVQLWQSFFVVVFLVDPNTTNIRQSSARQRNAI